MMVFVVFGRYRPLVCCDVGPKDEDLLSGSKTFNVGRHCVRYGMEVYPGRSC